LHSTEYVAIFEEKYAGECCITE